MARIALLGYGKMGKAIEQIALERGHEILHKIDVHNATEKKVLLKDKLDVVIEFSQPESAFENVKFCIENEIPVVCGTTGWLNKKPEIEKLVDKKAGTFFYASNYSIGVNMFFKVNEFLSNIMNNYPAYKVEIEEIHHTEKKDAPSGTAITLAEGILRNISRLQSWTTTKETCEKDLPINCLRISNTPGTHSVSFESEFDTIEIKHTAHTRKSFALGAVMVSEWVIGKKGSLTMDDYLHFF